MPKPDAIERAKAFAALSRVAFAFPELRLCQIIGNVLPREYNNDPYHLTDGRLAALLDEYMAAHKPERVKA